MEKMLKEIQEIPERARDFVHKSPAYKIPLSVPYLGMGSSYFASLAFKYMGVAIFPEIASEYYNYLSPGSKIPMAVILSQSGKSSEALWCTEVAENYIAISNDPASPMCQKKNVRETIQLHAGLEEFSSSKTYINTLLALFHGFGFSIQTMVDLLNSRISDYEQKGKQMADIVYSALAERKISGLYITGSGPNIATAMQAALILSESTKLNFHGLPMAQYDHGPKETAPGSIVVQIVSQGKSFARTARLSSTISKAGALVISVEEPLLEENFSIIANIVPFNFMAYYLAEKLNAGPPFSVGGKITEYTG
jgi:glutamine---fructose-6-phosphate transaminase (isomerizing)